MENVMKAIFGPSPRTTIIGYLGAVAAALLPLLQEGKYDWNMLLVAAVIAILGRFVKDANKTGVAVLALILASPLTAMAASSCVAALIDDGVIEYSWTAHTDGSFTETTCTPPYRIKGWVTDVITDPGSTAPQALYDITLKDRHGVDVSDGDLADRSATASERVQIGGYPVDGTLSLAITNNNVNGAVGKVYIYFIPRN